MTMNSPTPSTYLPSPNPNIKSFMAMDEAFLALSREAGADGDGEAYRKPSPEGHRFEIARSKTNSDSLEQWGPKVAQAAGCRIRIWGWSDDLTLIQGLLDADNWSLDPDGVAPPYSDDSFANAPGRLYYPENWSGPVIEPSFRLGIEVPGPTHHSTPDTQECRVSEFTTLPEAHDVKASEPPSPTKASVPECDALKQQVSSTEDLGADLPIVPASCMGPDHDLAAWLGVQALLAAGVPLSGIEKAIARLRQSLA